MTNGQQEINNFFKSYDVFIKTINTLQDVILKTTQMFGKSNPVLKELAKQLEKGNAAVLGTASFEEACQLQKKMRDAGIQYATAFRYNNEGYIVVPKQDLELAQKITQEYYNNHEFGGLTSKSVLASYADSDVMEIRSYSESSININETVVNMYEDYCRSNDIPIAIDGPEDGNYRIYFAERDKDTMDQIRRNVSFDLSSESGKLLRAQIKWKNSYEKNVINGVLNNKDLRGNDLAVGTRVVDKEGCSVEIRKHTIILSDGSNQKTIAKNSSDEAFSKSVKGFMLNMKDPVMLSKEEYDRFSKINDKIRRSDYLIDIERQAGRPRLSSEQIEQAAKDRAFQQKLNQNIYGSSRTIQDPYNENQSMWGFKEAERQNYEIIHDKAEAQYSDPTIYDDAQAEYQGIVNEMNEKYTDMEPMETEEPVVAWGVEDTILNNDEVEMSNIIDDDISLGTEMSDLDDLNME